MLRDFKTRFAEQTKRLDDLLKYENQADQQLLSEKHEREARKTFLSDLKSIGQPLSDAEVSALKQFMLDRQMDLRIPGAWTVAYVAANSEGLFEKMRVDEAEAAQAEEAKNIKAPTLQEKAPSSVKIEGNKTVTSYRREGDEGIPAEEMQALRPEKLDKKTLKDLKFKALQSRQEHMDPRAIEALNRGERTR